MRITHQLSKYILSISITIFSIGVIPVTAQELQNPFDFPILLSGNFGELRSNHFHAGIDFKTQGVEGKQMRAVEDGFISRISVSPWGYGNALYITHPNGITTVYGHLQKFSKEIAEYVKQKQYEQESFTVNLELPASEFPVQKGQVVALSGNTGSSAGPHLHFEVRDTGAEELLDPLEWYKDQIKDTRPPRIEGIMIYPMKGKGMVNRKAGKVPVKPTADANGKYRIANQIEAWGEIGIGIKAYDYMDNTTNIYGVKEVEMKVDNEVVFHSYLDRYAIKDTRYLNSFTDYEEWRTNRSFYMKSFVDPGNKLPFIQSYKRGILQINEERDYEITYRLADIYGNTTHLTFFITGKECPVQPVDTAITELFHWASDNRFGAKGIRLTIPKGNLYDNLYFRYQVKEDSTQLAATHMLHNKPVAFHQSAGLSIRLQHDTLSNKSQYGIVRIQNNRPVWIGGNYRNGWIDGTIRETGTYTLRADTIPPVITPLNWETWLSKQTFTCKLSDNLSGVKTYRGEIDGNFVLFEMNNRSVISHTFNRKDYEPGAHMLKIAVQDACGNEATYEYAFNL
ncbi:MAG: M23 family metallopeptidase [Tannerellaceae bacterium]|nr:M23 family metallopeptidase [Tannerellaceae bacterium]MCD8263696.1 M23 family metallopeptidase [Tannerellaceae bacterium]